MCGHQLRVLLQLRRESAFASPAEEAQIKADYNEQLAVDKAAFAEEFDAEDFEEEIEDEDEDYEDELEVRQHSITLHYSVSVTEIHSWNNRTKKSASWSLKARSRREMKRVRTRA